MTQQPGDQLNPQSASFMDGGHVVVWTSPDPNGGTNSAIDAQVYDAQGQPLGAPMQLFTEVTTLGDVQLGAGGVRVLADGSFVVSARSERLMPGSAPDWVVWAERLSRTGDEVVAPAEVTRLSSADYPSVSAGQVLVSPGGSRYYIEADTMGRPIPNAFFGGQLEEFDAGGGVVGQQIGWSSLDRSGSDAVVLAGGNVLVVNTNTGPFGNALSLNLAAYDPSGSAAGTSNSIGSLGGSTSLGSGAKLAALATGNAVLVWRQQHLDGSITWFSQLVGPDAQPLGMPQQLAIDLGSVAMTSLTTGGALAWWNPGSGFVGQYIDGSGQLTGDTIPIGSNVVSVAAMPDGGFLVQSVQQGTSTGKDIDEQRFVPQ